MLPRINMPRRRRPPLLNMAAAIVLLPAVTVAQAPPAAADPAPDAAPLLDWSHARSMYQLAERWLEIGSTGDSSPQPTWVAGATGVRVTVRWLGRTMGSGQAVIDQQTLARDQVVDLAKLTRQATDAAIVDMIASLRARNERARLRAENPESFSPWTLENVRPTQLDVQIAQRPHAIRLQADAPPGAVFGQFAPGFHGLILSAERSGDDPLTTWSWPADVIATNTSPASQLIQMLGDVGYAPSEVQTMLTGDVARPEGPRLARFEVIHLVRPGRDQPIMQLVRGNRVLPPTAVTGRTVEEMAARLAAHLVQRQREDGSMIGTYHPTSDRFDPPLAPTHDLALATYALRRAARQLDGVAAQEIRAGADVAIQYLIRKVMAGDAPPQPAACALLLMTLLETDDPQQHAVAVDQLTQSLLQLQDGSGRFAAATTDGRELANAPVQALVVLALATQYEHSPDPAVLLAVNRARTALAAQLQDHPVVPSLPWLAMAEYRLARLPESADKPQTSVGNFAGLATALRQRQVSAAPAVGPSDVIGGFNPAAADAAIPVPDWHTAAVLAFLAITLRQQDVIDPQERMTWLLDCGLAARFLAQLMFDEPSCYYVRSSRDVLGAVRPALWDNRLSVGPTAMTLLAVTELLDTLDALAEPDVIPEEQHTTDSSK